MSARARLLIALVSTGVVGYLAVGSVLGRVLGDSTYSQLALFNEVTRLVMETYVEPIDVGRAMGVANMGLTEALDGDSGYLDEDEFQAYQSGPAHDSDAEIGVTVTRRFSFLMIVSVRAGSPAARADLRPGDIIKTIDGRHSRHVPAAAGARLLRGAPGSMVKLAILRGRTNPTEHSVVRERLLPLEVESRSLEQGVAHVVVPEFTENTAENLRTALEVLKRGGSKKLVLDLRGAGTGPLLEGVEVGEMFLDSGVVARLVRRKNSEQVWTAAAARQAWDDPLAVLIDHGTAGPGEIVAAALAHAKRGPLVGQRTFGRTGVQKGIPLVQGGLVLTVAKYLRPDGEPLHGHGVEPTEIVPAATGDHKEEGPASVQPEKDVVLEKAIELLAEKQAERKAA